MRHTSRVQIYQEVVDKITCNKCGMDADIEWGFDGIHGDVQGGYGSKHLGDGNRYVFDVCEECLVAFMNGFAIPAENEDLWGRG